MGYYDNDILSDIEQLLKLLGKVDLFHDRKLSSRPLQQIFYGAPGTGKSHKVKEITSQMPKENVFRTTFHPDSDYSTFVGCYKPTKKNGMTKQILDWKDLVEKLKEYRNKYAETDAQVMFGCEYYQSLRGCENLGQLLEDAGGKNYDTYIKAGMKVAEDLNPRSGNSQITYEFVPQVFTKAYVRTHQTDEPVFLVIEEINRGNCAQIFGDIFQLLDRDENGVSNYAVKPDSDLEQYLIEHVDGYNPEEGMRLPNNLHIWATMNTSDQSLFPIDSAFKRRWEWQYMPIGKGYDENGQEIKWAIEGATKKYSWWSFLEKINAQIAEATQSEDKKLGFFFCKATDNVISAEKFVGKVIFYLWNDVFKNNGFEGPIFKDTDGSELSFGKFYKSDTKGNAIVQKDKVELFLNNLGVEEFKDENNTPEQEEDEDGNVTSSPSAGRDYTKFSVNGNGRYAKNNLAAECVKKYIELNPTKSAEEILSDWLSLGNIVPHFVESKEQYEARTDNSKRSHEIPCAGTVIYVAHNGYGSNGKVLVLKEAVNQKNWGITIDQA